MTDLSDISLHVASAPIVSHFRMLLAFDPSLWLVASV